MRRFLGCLWVLTMLACGGRGEGTTSPDGSAAAAGAAADPAAGAAADPADGPTSMPTAAAEEGGGGEEPVLAPAAAEPAESAEPADEAGAADEMPEDGSGQTTSIGASPECEPEQCAQELQDFADGLSMPRTAWRMFDGGSCELQGVAGVATGYACSCPTEFGDHRVGPVGVGCYARGRTGDCLWGDDEFSGCDPLADTCDAVCEELEARYRADAETSFDVTVRHTECRDGYCRSVLRIDDRCYADRSFQRGLAYSCELDDAEIIERYLEDRFAPQPLPPECGSPEDTGSICVEPVDPEEDDCAPRDPQEWQGMRVCGPYLLCEVSSNCGSARACIEERCVACRIDEDCAPSEGCVLEHCLPEANIECRSASECAGDAICYLTGYAGGTARANETMEAVCLDPSGGGSE